MHAWGLMWCTRQYDTSNCIATIYTMDQEIFVAKILIISL